MSDFTPFEPARRAGFRATSFTTGPIAIEPPPKPPPQPDAEPEQPESTGESAPPPETDPDYLDELLLAARRAGRAEAEAELMPEIEMLEQTVAALGPALDSIARLRRDALEHAARDVGEIIVAICKRVVDEAFSARPQAIARVVEEAIAQLPEAEDVRVAVPPALVEHVTRNVDSRFRSHIVPDDSVGNGCVIRTRYVTLDATVESAMAGVDAAIREWVSLHPWSESP